MQVRKEPLRPLLRMWLEVELIVLVLGRASASGPGHRVWADSDAGARHAPGLTTTRPDGKSVSKTLCPTPPRSNFPVQWARICMTGMCREFRVSFPEIVAPSARNGPCLGSVKLLATFGGCPSQAGVVVGRHAIAASSCSTAGSARIRRTWTSAQAHSPSLSEP